MFNDPQGCKFVLKHENGTYFVKWTKLGPMFGGTLAEAKRFESRESTAGLLMDWRTGDSVVETVIE